LGGAGRRPLVRDNQVHRPDPATSLGALVRLSSLAVRLQNSGQLLPDRLDLIDGQPEVGDGQDPRVPPPGRFRVAGLGELDGQRPGGVDDGGAQGISLLAGGAVAAVLSPRDVYAVAGLLGVAAAIVVGIIDASRTCGPSGDDVIDAPAYEELRSSIGPPVFAALCARSSVCSSFMFAIRTSRDLACSARCAFPLATQSTLDTVHGALGGLWPITLPETRFGKGRSALGGARRPRGQRRLPDRLKKC
jgi:hypothetical protein